MANISIRNLDAGIKQALRRRAAAAGCSMEEFLRRSLAHMAAGEADAPHIISAENSSAAAIGREAERADAPAAGQTVAGDIYALAEAGGEAALRGRQILLIIGGSIAAYKALELIRLLRRAGAQVKVILTKAAQAFITPLAAGALSAAPVYSELFAREEEQDIGHIRLARSADIILVAPATASRMAKMAAGLADDLAGAVLLAARAPILLAPAMNPAMWAHKATQRNQALLMAEGCLFIGPEKGEMAESGEAGLGRMAEPAAICAAAAAMAAKLPQTGAEGGAAGLRAAAQPSLPLAGKHILITAGPTYEAIDPVRYIANYSSGKQGYAIAAACAALGARVSLIAGPTSLPDPQGVEVAHIVSGREMLAAVKAALPADAAVFAAAVADWRPRFAAADKIKKQAQADSANGGQGGGERGGGEAAAPLRLELVENPDILAAIGHLPKAQRPRLIVGFAAETADLLTHAQAKLTRKGADWILANNVSRQVDGSSVMGGDANHIYFLSRESAEEWPEMAKTAAAARLAEKIAAFLSGQAAAAE